MSATVLGQNRVRVGQRQMVFAVAFSCFGWAFDLFDLFILLYIAPILAKAFFASSYSMLSIAGVYAAFTASLLMRPVGGVVFGRYADKNGRKRAMITAAVGVGLATALMGAIPTIAMIGIAAPIIFIVLRLVQGVFMGGMVASTHTIGTETISKKWRGLASGIISGGGSGIGKLMASLIFLLITFIAPGPAFGEWGWRVMFFTGLLSSLLGWFVFAKLQESPMWEGLQQPTPSGHESIAKKPIKELAQGGYLGVLFVCILLTMAGGGLSYLTSGFLPTFLRLINHVSPDSLGVILSLSAIAVIISSVVAGFLTDIIGRKLAIVLYGLICLVAIPFFYRQLTEATDIYQIGLLSILLSGIGTFCYAPLVIILNERFPTFVRASGTAISWNIGFALGGSMPVVVSLFSKVASDLPEILIISTAALSAIYLISIYFLGARRGEMT
jgi:MHS family proline/betaine transporter-like MFS transporter